MPAARLIQRAWRGIIASRVEQRSARVIEHAWLWHVDSYRWYFERELTAPSTIDLVNHIDRMSVESADTGDTPRYCGILPPPFRFLLRPRPPDLRQACLE